MLGRTRHWISIALVLGFVFRLAFVLATFDRPLEGDEVGYDQLAWNVASGHGYCFGLTDAERIPTAARGPGYILLLAAVYRVAGHHVLPVLLLQALLDTLCLWLVWRIGSRIFSDPALAAGGALLYAVYPPFILYSGQLVTETYVTLTVLLAIFFGLEWAIGGRRSGLALSGLAIGLCALSKPQIAPVAVLIALAGRPNLRSREFWLAATLQVAVVSAVLAPWIIRNAVTFHALIPGVAVGGLAFWGGTGPANGLSIGGLGDPNVPAHVTATIRGMTELQRDHWFYAEGLRVIERDPAGYAVLMFKKLMRLWFNLLHDAPPSRASLAIAAFNALALGLCGWGIWRMRPPAAAVRLLVGLLAYFSVVHMLFFAVVRYSMPCYAYLFCFTGAAAFTLPGMPGASAGSGRRTAPAAAGR
jgi:hypothetical protein